MLVITTLWSLRLKVCLVCKAGKYSNTAGLLGRAGLKNYSPEIPKKPQRCKSRLRTAEEGCE